MIHPSDMTPMASDSPAPVSVAQNTDQAQRLVAAQSRLYTDAKRIHDIRIAIVVCLAIVTIVVALSFPSVRPVVGTVGGVISFLWSVLGSGREKRCRAHAAFVQEEFDTHVFGLPWNDMAAEHPSPTLIAEAATRYRGSRTRDWYPDTGAVARPLDILICQRSNLGWGSSMHRFYAGILTGALLVLLLSASAVWLLVDLSALDVLTAVMVPLLGPARELIELIRAHRDNSESKSKIESKLMSLWNRSLQGPHMLDLIECRRVQDRILASRQTNAHIPDWLDHMRRKHQETAMRTSAQHLIEQAIEHGKTR